MNLETLIDAIYTLQKEAAPFYMQAGGKRGKVTLSGPGSGRGAGAGPNMSQAPLSGQRSGASGMSMAPKPSGFGKAVSSAKSWWKGLGQKPAASVGAGGALAGTKQVGKLPIATPKKPAFYLGAGMKRGPAPGSSRPAAAKPAKALTSARAGRRVAEDIFGPARNVGATSRDVKDIGRIVQGVGNRAGAFAKKTKGLADAARAGRTKRMAALLD